MARASAKSDRNKRTRNPRASGTVRGYPTTEYKQLELYYPPTTHSTIPEHLTGAKASSNRLGVPVPVGIVLFNDPDAPEEGVAYLSIGPAQQIRCANDLRSDVLWISNLNSIEAFPALSVIPNLRASNYLSFTLADIAHDLGIDITREGQIDHTDAMKLAGVLTRAMTIATRAYGWDAPELGPLRIQDLYLSLDIARALPTPPQMLTEHRSELAHALTQAYQDDSVPNWSAYHSDGKSESAQSAYVTLRFNRLNYARALLACPIPKGVHWSYAPNVVMSDALMEYCLAHASIVKASVEFSATDSDLAALIAFGKTGKRRSPMRLWLAQPELAWLSQYARISIHAVLVSDAGYTTLPRSAQLPVLFDTHPQACLSYSVGLIAHNHWQSLSACRWNASSKIDESNVWATWLRAYDRANMFALALKAHEAGFHVERYGAGSLKLSVAKTEQNYAALADFKHLHGLIYPDLAMMLREREKPIVLREAFKVGI